MKGHKIIKILHKYCDRIRFNGNHYVCYPKGVKSCITVSASQSDNYASTQVYRDFRRIGIIVNELDYSHK